MRSYTSCPWSIALLLVAPAAAQVTTCVVTQSPSPGVASADIAIVFDADNPLGRALRCTLEISTDGGVGWMLATPAPASPNDNPITGLAVPASAVAFTWDSWADGAGWAQAQQVQLRVRAEQEQRASGSLVEHPTRPAFGAYNTYAAALGDIDGDLDLDCVTADTEPGPKHVWVNDGGGAFWPHSTAPEVGGGSGANAVALGDLDGDLDLDLVLCGDQTRVLLNDGLGAFTPHPVAPVFSSGHRTFGVALGDLDGDLDLDMVQASNFNRPETVWLNDGSGVFLPHPVRPELGAEDSWSVALGDMDGDLDLDLVVGSEWLGVQRLWVNDGSGAFSPHPTCHTFEPGWTRSVALGDLDGDLDLDVVLANQWGEQVVLQNDGAGQLARHPLTPLFGTDLTQWVGLGDLDLDGDLDAVTVTHSALSEIWLNDGAGNFSAHPQTPSFGTPASTMDAALGDLDGDGTLDLVLTNDGNQAENVWLGEPIPVAGSGICTSGSFMVDNRPTCSITAPPPMTPVVPDMAITFSGESLGGAAIASTIEFSEDGGASWRLATPSPGSALQNPDVARSSPFTGAVFTWDTDGDLRSLPLSSQVSLRIRSDDGNGVGECSVTLDLACTTCGDCDLSASAPDILDALIAARYGVGLVGLPARNLTCCDVDDDGSVDILDAQFIAQTAVVSPVALGCP